jgi:hypothetical protein
MEEMDLSNSGLYKMSGFGISGAEFLGSALIVLVT